MEDQGNRSDAWPEAGADLASMGAPAPDPSEPGWGETDWQHYDWRAAAALGETSVDEATTEWAATDGDSTGHRPREPRQSAANAIATALDEIARRIREGDLSSSGPGPMTIRPRSPQPSLRFWGFAASPRMESPPRGSRPRAGGWLFGGMSWRWLASSGWQAG